MAALIALKITDILQVTMDDLLAIYFHTFKL